MTIPAFPLAWPAGWKRTAPSDKSSARFGKATGNLSIADGVKRVLAELRMMGVGDDDVVVSTNVQLRLDGFPRSDRAEPADCGAAVYWQDSVNRGAPPKCMAVDRYDRVADNLAAIAATLNAMRAIERHGGAAILERAFSGFVALEAPAEHWSKVFGVAIDADVALVKLEYQRRRSVTHPDRGGDADRFDAIERAWDRFKADRGIR